MSGQFTFQRLGLLVLPLLCLAGRSSAALDPEKTVPYELKIVVHLGDSPWLRTDPFRDRIERGLEDYLRAAFGNLVRVKVGRDDRHLPDVLDKGLQRALDNWKERSNTKTHFVLIDFVNGYYEIRTRQHDGLTGQASPIVRADHTRDRAFVARVAAGLVEQDFGIVGTFDTWPTGAEPPQDIRLQLKGADLGVPLGAWVQKGDIFQIVRIPNGDRLQTLVEWALLRVKEAPGPDGSCPCSLYWRYTEPLGGDVAGYRCSKIDAIKGAVRLRVSQETDNGRALTIPSSGLGVEIRRNTFVEANAVNGRLSFGAFDSSKLPGAEPFDRMALVDLVSAGKRIAQFPVALVDQQPVTVLLHAVNEEGNLARYRLKNWQDRVVASYLVQENYIKTLRAASANARAESVNLAKLALKRCRDDYDALMKARQELHVPEGSLALEDMLKRMPENEKRLQEYINKQEEIIKEEQDPERQKLRDQIEKAKLLEAEAEYDKAIEIYQAVVNNGRFTFTNVPERLKKLEEDWQHPKSQEQVDARNFIYNEWPKLGTEDLSQGITKALKCLQVLHDAGDHLAPRKLVPGGINAHLVRLAKELDSLKENNEDDQNKIKTIKEATLGLSKLNEEAVKLFPELKPQN